MRQLTLGSITMAIMLLASGCIVVSDRDKERPIVVERADLTILYSFGGRILDSGAACSDVGVSTIRVSVEGVGVSDGTVKEERCQDFYQGMRIKDLMTGSYDVMVSATDSVGHTLYELGGVARSTVTSTGGEIDVDLAARFGSLTVWWRSFGEIDGANKCVESGVYDVRATLYDSTGRLVADDYLDCDYQGVIWDFLAPGTYEVILNGNDEHDLVLYAGASLIEVRAGEDRSYDVDLDMIVGDLTVYWTFNGSTSCGSVDSIQVHLYDPWDDLYDSYSYPCSDTGVFYANVVAGEWLVTLEALSSTNRVLYRTAQGGILLDVEPGVHNEYIVDLR